LKGDLSLITGPHSLERILLECSPERAIFGVGIDEFRNCPGSCSQTVRSERINLSGSCISI
jgi:hypothetical protein